MRKLLAALGIVAVVAAGSANATWSPIATHVWTNYNTWYTGFSGGFYWGDGNQYVNCYLTTFGLALPSGQGLDWLNGGGWYCADMHENVGNSYRSYYWTDDNVGIIDLVTHLNRHQGTAAGNRRAAWLLNKWGAVTGNTARAALQVAVWEAIYDNGGSFAVGNHAGNFWVGSISSQQSAILTAAAGYYNGSSDDGVGIYADDAQNLLRGVPEPGTVVLLGLGLAASGIAFLRRRRS